ncbi:MAG TPA: ACP phosphodiesterase [Bacteroidales bacterium]|jgi:acyl carrier protein phosphodiesterase|nr:ACP phosphodiesterase [Bacteroidales bacterium]|tara:strand:+ start:1107 stop:1706 length:600 start_codon:yes stop_codon:yes gene_type:complete
MNFLAHAHLSQDNEDVIFGNFIADAIKGKSYLKFRKDIMYGILLHRDIDTFTDKHRIVKNSRAEIRENFGKFSGIVVDIYYDHFLARNWTQYHNLELAQYSTHVYLILAKRFLLLPSRIKLLLPFLIGQNWLVGYANLNDLQNVFNGMDRRTGYVSGMGNAVKVLEEKYDLLHMDFKAFYSELEKYSANRLFEISNEGN